MGVTPREYELSLTPVQRGVIAYLTKPFALLSFVSSAYVVYVILHRKPQRIRKLYHRLALAMNVNGMVNSIFVFWGGWAVPSDAAGFVGARGTNLTCTMQGFALHTFGSAMSFYYASLSLYVFLAVKHDFRASEIGWVEKWIHGLAYVFPVASSVFLTSQESFNPVGPFCWVNSYNGCEDDPEPECYRGPTRPDVYALMFGAAPVILLLLLATAFIVLCYLSERKKESSNARSLHGKRLFLEEARRRKSRLIGRQGSFYLAVFYASYTLPTIAALTQIILKKPHFPTMVLATVFWPLDGFFFSLAYLWLLPRENDGEDVSLMTRQMSLPSLARQSSVLSHASSTVCPGPKVAIGTLARAASTREQGSFEQQETGTSERRWSNPDKRRKSGVSVSLFDGTDEDKWKQFGVYVGDESDESDGDDFTDNALDTSEGHLSLS